MINRNLNLIQCLFFCVMAVLTLNTYSNEINWNQFRGPNGSGVAVDAKPPIDFGLDKNLKWKIEMLPGRSSPVIWEDKIFITGMQDEQFETICINRDTGEIHWRKTGPNVPLETHHPDNSPASSTPFIDSENVYVYFGSFGLLCYDHLGNEMWQMPIPTPRNMHGTATSPILYKNMLFLIHDSMDGDSYMLAVDKNTGEELWKTKRTVFRPNWSTPVIWNYNDRSELVMLGGGMLQAYDPKSGEELWSVTGFGSSIPIPVVDEHHIYASTMSGTDGEVTFDLASWDYYLKFDTTQDGTVKIDDIPDDAQIQADPSRPEATTPTKEAASWMDANQDRVLVKEEFQQFMKLISTNERSSIQAIRPGGKGDITNSHVAWKYERAIPFMSSCLLYEGNIYMCKSGGILTCLDAMSGEEKYRKRIGRGNYVASPVAANGHMYISSRDGIITIYKFGDEPEVITDINLDENIDATPAIQGNAIYVRTVNHLYAFQN